MTRKITITPVLNGFICEVGCQHVVFNSRQTLLAALSDYMNNPKVMEENFLAQAINPDLKRDDGPCLAQDGVRDLRARVNPIPAPSPFERVPESARPG